MLKYVQEIVKKQVRSAAQPLRFFSSDRLDQITYASLLVMLAVIPFAKAVIEIYLFIGVAAWLLRKIIDRDLFLRQVPFKGIYILYILACAISVFNSEYLAASLRGIQKVTKYFLLYCAAAETFTTKERVNYAIKVVLISAVLGCFDGFYQYWTGWNFRHSRDFLLDQNVRRISATFNHPNNFGAYLLTVITIALFSEQVGAKRFFKISVATLAFITLMLTESRSSLIVLIFILAFGSLFRNSNRLFVLSFLTLMCIWVAVRMGFDTQFGQRLITIRSGNERLFFWRIAVEMFMRHPLFGVGINSYMSNFPHQVGELRYVSLQSGAYAHSIIFQVLAETGLSGLVALAVLLGNIFYKGWSAVFKNSLGGQCLIWSGLALFLHSCVETDLQSLQLSTFFWFLLGTLMGYSRSS